jgi:hypothetical protein
LRKNAFILILAFAGSFFPLFSSIKVTQNTPQRIVFTWEPDGFDTCTLIDSGRFASNISFGSENTVLAGEGGEVLPGQSLYAGVPSSGDVGITFTPGQVRTVHLGFPLRKFKNNDRLEPEGRLIPGTLWTVEKKYTRFRGLRALRLVICPVRWDETSSTVQLLESAECSIEFPSIISSSRPGPGMTDYERMLKKLILNYDIASSWTVPDLHPLKKAVDPYPFDYNQPAYCFKIGDGHAGFNEMTVKENGILKIQGSQIRRLFSSDSALIGMNRVALYGSWKGSLPMDAPGTGAIPAGVTEVPMLRVDVDHNGKVDDGDYFLAWVTGLSDWGFDSTRGDYTFKVDPYTDNRTYRLSLKPAGSGLTMDKFTQPSSPAYTVDGVRTPVCLKQSNHPYSIIDENTMVSSPADGPGFILACLKPTAAEFRMTLDLPEYDSSRGGAIRFAVTGPSFAFDVAIGGEPVAAGCLAGNVYQVGRWGDRSLRVVATGVTALNYLQFDHVRVDYEQPLYAGRDTVRMQVFSVVDSQPVAYRLSGIAGKRLCILRISDDESALSLIDIVDSADTYSWSDFGASGVRYAVSNEAGFIHLNDEAFSVLRRTASSGFFVGSLRDPGNESDYLIITQPGFFGPAKRLAEHKAKNGFGKPRIVSVDDIYLDFAGGNLDPTAIRNFLAYARRNWISGDKLDYVLLMGSGHYDYKQVKTGEPNIIPPAEVTINYQSSEFKFGDSGIDDFYAYLGTRDGDALSLALGRLPCMTENEATVMVDKIIEIEDPLKADFGPWRNSMLLVADDDMQGTKYDIINHTGSSEKVAGCVDAERYSMNIRKTYLFDYEWNANGEKPEASRAIINEINNGVGYVNFFGHGSDVYWTDEHVLSPDIAPQLNNKKHYPLISSFSNCPTPEP